MTNASVSPSLSDVRDTFRQELDHNRRDIDEMARLMRQIQAEADKLAQREVNASSQMRNIQANIDRYSKDDIRSVFGALHEVQVRLVSARSQVEQIEDKQRRLHERQNELGTLIELLDGIGSVEQSDQIGAQTSHTTLIAEVMEAQEKERLRISLQMHDGPTQMLSNLILRAEICERMIDRDTVQAKAELGSLKKAISGVLQETRRFIFDLRPMILDDLGLVPTLRRYAQDFAEKYSLDVQVAVQNLDTRLPKQYEVALFRFVQEALHNVEKHAHATHARIVLDGLENEIQVLVEDDGNGFNLDEALSGGRSNRNMGFAVMKQQIETLLRGQLGLESAPGRGTRVYATVPVVSG